MVVSLTINNIYLIKNIKNKQLNKNYTDNSNKKINNKNKVHLNSEQASKEELHKSIVMN